MSKKSLKRAPTEILSTARARDLIAKKLRHLKRKAWIPITVEGDGELTASKFMGSPWSSIDEEWPICPNCGNPMHFFLQLNL